MTSSPSNAGRRASARLGFLQGPDPFGATPPGGRSALPACGRLGDRVADEALRWIDTPFVWGQAQRGRGCDCKGLVAGIARELELREAASAHALAQDYGAGRFSPARLLAGLASVFDRVALATPAMRGDIAVLPIKGAPQHLGIVTAVAEGVPVRMVEAYLALGRVREITVSPSHRLHSLWRWKDESPRPNATLHEDGR